MIADQMIEDVPIRVGGSGTEVSIRMPWYRALPLSCVSDFGLAIDGQELDPDHLRLVVDGTAYAREELPPRHDRWWYVLDSALISAPGLSLGEGSRHQVTVMVELLIPYTPVDGAAPRVRETWTKELIAEVSK